MHFIGSDHAGFKTKEKLKDQFAHLNFQDLGCFDENSVDYPDIAKAVAQKVQETPNSYGVLICGSGMGMMIAANRFQKVRAILGSHHKTTELARQHNNANIICFGARIYDYEHIVKNLQIFLETPYNSIERHEKRILKIDE